MHAEAIGELIVAEPKAAYTARRPMVVDCSVIAAMVFDESRHDEAVFAINGQELFAPHLLDHEMIHVAVKKAMDGLLDDARNGLADFTVMPITRRTVNTTAQWRTAVDYDLSGYDAAYLQLALDLQAPLATFDQRLGTAARRALAR